MTMQAYFAGRSWSGRRKARCAGVAVLGAVGAFVFLLCAIAVMFELEATSQPTGGALDSTFVGLLALGALLAVAVPLLVGRLALGQQR